MTQEVNKARLILETVYDQYPPFIEIIVNNKKLFQGNVGKNFDFDFDYPDNKRFSMQIVKNGKTKKMVDNNLRQETHIKSLTLNNCNLHPDKFGIFFTKNNSYLGGRELQTDQLHLNGKWIFDIPLFDIGVGKSSHSNNDNHGPREEHFQTEIACFGCSFTYGVGLENDQTWPKILSNICQKEVGNFGKGGSSIQEILADAYEYCKKYKPKKIVLLLPHPSRVQVKNKQGKLASLMVNNYDKDTISLYKNLYHNIINYGESSVIFSTYQKIFFEEIKKIFDLGTMIYISSWASCFYRVLQNFKNNDFTLLPYYFRQKKYSFADDTGHPGPEHNRQFAEKVLKCVNS